MSLKAFHVLFITASIVLATGFGIWAIRDFTRSAEPGSIVAGVLSLIGAAALLWYGRWVLRKLEGVGWL